MPYKIILADDEPKLIRLIKELVDFKELGIEIVAECRDGEEAYQKILEYQPDIVLSDIKMPVYDGICLIEKVRKHGLNTRFILISGYRHFEYARSAVRLNVVDYLLKPIDAVQLKETMIKACRKIDQMRNLDADSEELKKIKTEQKKNRMEGFWNYLAQRESEGETRLLTEEICNRDYHTSFQTGCYEVLCIYCNINGLLGQPDSSLIEKMNVTMDKTLGEVGRVYYHAASCQSYLLVVNFNAEQRRQVREAIVAMYYSVRDMRDISLEEVARVANVSPAYFSKLFKAEMQCGFLEYLTQLRLNESEKLLSESSLSIKEIALSVGYPDEKYYSKLFKKMTGIKPSEFRKIYS